MLPEMLRTRHTLCTISRLRKLAATALVAAAFAALGAAPLSAQTALVTNRLTQPIDETSRITLKGTVSPLANARNDRGPASDSMPLDRIQVMLKRSSAQESALKQLISDMHTPGTASYHKWLTPDEFGKQFGASDQDIATVEAWLQSKGFSVTKVNPGKQTLEISGSVAQFRTAFSTQIHKYVVNGETHYANATDPQIPAALAPVFGGFASLNNFHPKRFSHVLGQATYNPKTNQAKPQWTTGSGTDLNYLLAPGDFGIQYDLPNAALNSGYTGTTTYDGSGQSLAIINDANINVGLVNQFRSLFGLPANPPQVIIDGNDPGVDGVNNVDGANGDSIETYLDVEWSGAVAPAATIDLVIGADTAIESGLFLAAQRAVYSNIAPVISLSFGYCEAELGSTNQFFDALWQQAAAQGITVLVSTGDGGSSSPGCDDDNTQYYAVHGLGVSGFASTPYNVAVGGTDFYYSDYASGGASISTYWNTTPSNSTPTVSIKKVIPEQPWNASQYGFNIFNQYAADGTTSIAGGAGGASSAAICSTNAYDSNDECTGTASGYPKPVWQSATGVPNDNVRDLPDLSLFASSGANLSAYPLCYADGDCQPAASGDTVQITEVGGTSASTPAFAAMMALVNQAQTLKLGSPQRQGQADYVLYPLAAQFPATFHDVTVGTNSVPCAYSATAADDSPNCIAVASPLTVTDPTYGTAIEGQLGKGTTANYNAVAGYDLATGLGTIDATQLVTNWGSVTFSPSTVTLTSPTAGASFTHGSSVTFTGAVAPSGATPVTPTGNVAIETDSAEPGQQGQLNLALSSGAFSGSTTMLPGGTYNVWANYPGDNKNAANVSAKTQITVSPEASGILLQVLNPSSSGTSIVNASSGNIPYGTQLILSAQVAPSSALAALTTCQTSTTTACPTFTEPTGTVTFSDGGAAVNTAAINAEGDAEYNPTDVVAPHTTTSVGSHSITASFPGDKSYNASTAAAVTYTVVKATPTLNVGTGGNFVAGQASTVTIQIASGGFGAAPTGTVTLTGLPSGTPTSATLSPGVDPNTGASLGVATFLVPSTAGTGTYTLTSGYSGDANYNSIASSALGTVQITGASTLKATTTSVVTTAATTTPNAAVSFAITVTGSGTTAPTGNVDIELSGYDIGTFSLTPVTGTDTATVVLSGDSRAYFQGANFITATYSGDTNYAASVGTASISNPLTDFTLVPSTTILVVPGVTTATVTLTSTNGFTGNVALTCVGSGGVGCTLSNASPTLTAGGSASVTLTVDNNNVAAAGNYNVIITGTDSTGEYVHTLGLAVTAPATTLPPGLTLTGPTGITIQNPGDTGTGTLTVSPQGGLTGATSFACNVNGSPAGITCSAPATAAGGTTSTLSVITTASAVPGNYTAMVTATQGTVSSAPLSVPIVLSAAAAITLSNSGAITLASPGASGTSTISVTPAGGFTGNVTLACSITTSPAGATEPPTCSIAGTLDVTSTTAATTTLTVNTTAASTSALERPLDKLFAVGGGIAVAGLLLFTIPARRRSWRSILGVLVFAAFVGIGIGCGGGGSSGGGGGGGGGGNSGTTTGAYVVTVTGTDAATGKITGSTAVNVTVN